MKTFLPIFLFCASMLAGPIYQYDPASLWVTNRGVWRDWGDTLQYLGKPGYLVDVMAFPVGIPLEYTKASNGVVRALTSVESNLVFSLSASNVTYQAAVARTNVMDTAVGGFTDTNAVSRLERAIIIGVMNELNNIRTQAVWSALPARTTNQFVTGLSNLIRLDPR